MLKSSALRAAFMPFLLSGAPASRASASVESMSNVLELYADLVPLSARWRTGVGGVHMVRSLAKNHIFWRFVSTSCHSVAGGS